MKKTLALFLALVTGSVFAAMPVEKSITHVSTPIQLGADEYHYLYPKEYGVHGLRLNCYFVENRYMHGFDFGFWNVSEDASGVQLALYRNETHDFGGIQLSLWNAETKNVGGFQIATVSTDAEDLSGVQLTGLLGKAREVSGIQIGGLTAESETETDKGWAKGAQFSLFKTAAENMAGVQIGGVFTETSWYANGVQLGLLFTKSRYTRGVQLGGLTARAQETTGFQFGGLMAKSEIKSTGVMQGALILAETGELDGCLQLAALSANVIGSSDGIQIGGVSTMAGSLDGLQVAGVWNFVFENVSGTQIGLLYNHARYVRGLQLGLINHCERLDGVQIGLINTVKEARFSTCPLLRVDF
jgi:hypothetical protein